MVISYRDLFLLGLSVLVANGATTAREPEWEQHHTRICENTPGVKAYSGYVNLPGSTTEGRLYDIHIFFWFFEARKDPYKNGPCLVTHDSKNTVWNPWSLINGTIDETLLPYEVTPLPLSSPDPLSTANTTAIAALAYKPRDNKFSIWTESYGGYYGPAFADFFTVQTQKIADSRITSGAVPLQVDTMGIINGCVDIFTQMPSYPRMVYNNTYGVRVTNETEYDTAPAMFPACRESVESCRAHAAERDPTGLGNVEEVNKACNEAYLLCFATMWGGVQDRGRDIFDITATYPSAFPPKYAGGYLNSREAQQEVKVGLVYRDRDCQCNWYGGEQVSLAIQSKTRQGFHAAGYADIQTNKTYTGGLVRQYGNLSFSRVFGAGHESKFSTAPPYRMQLFWLILCLAPWYQPETAYQIFRRVMFNKDVATGGISTAKCRGKVYSTTGPGDVSGILNELPSHPEPECYLWDIFQTCTPLQTEMLRNGTAVLKDFIMIGYTLPNGAVHYY
ncbi:Alpha/Beta hydrolase protein [Chaetomium strumarium]|uniref:Alpha/Beta hydrolase protein n=1 Tax=Chaetomium strumarium TaxID=1170767 RepID=A0AAJ0GU82_9PEZI|nr:Alpha/Beta hydrolase protein [Chaetomium strumarium]